MKKHHYLAGIGMVCGLTGAATAQDIWRGVWNPTVTQENPAPNVGGILFPHVHVRSALGSRSADELALGAHDPKRNGFNVQGVELGTSLRYGQYLEGFVTGNAFWENGEGWDAEWEEAFLKLVNLPGGFEVRGGRFLNRAGFENSVHLHGWRFVDQNLLVGRYLGEEGMITEGGEIAWNMPSENPTITTQLGLSFGQIPSHDHGSHEEESEEEHEEHGHGEEALLTRDVLGTYVLTRWRPNDFHTWTFMQSGQFGDNAFGGEGEIYQTSLSYEWRENGLEAGGQSVRAAVEYVHRVTEGNEEGEDFRARDNGIYTMLNYGFGQAWETGIRYGWLNGSELLETESRQQISAMVGKRVNFENFTSALVRLQYNMDRLPENDEHSIWLQVGFDWGGPEVR